MHKLLSILISTAAVQAAVITYTGQDPGAGPGDPIPNSAAAAAQFQAALGSNPFATVNFEGLPIDYAEILDLGPMNVQQIGTSSEADGGITAGDSTPPSLSLGFNTTPGGSQFLRVVPLFDAQLSGVRFIFDLPVDFFGAYLTGVSNVVGPLRVEFSDGTAQSFLINPLDATGGVIFFGFTSFGSPVSEVSFVRDSTDPFIRDIYSIDDIVAGQAAASAVPEPGTWVLLGGGLLTIAAVRRRLA